MDISSIYINSNINDIFNFMCDIQQINLWSFGIQWDLEHIFEGGIIQGISTYDQSISYLKITKNEKSKKINYWIGRDLQNLISRIYVRICPTNNINVNELSMIALRMDDMDDERWDNLIHLHQSEIKIIKELIEKKNIHLIKKELNYNIQAIIEIPYQTCVKYEYDEKFKMLRCDRILNTSMLYPGNYGYIPNTLGGDGDPLDILVLCDYQLYPCIIIECKVIGVLIMEDEKGFDEKIISVPSELVNSNSKFIKNINDISSIDLNKIKHFFEYYKMNDKDKWCKVYDFQNKEEAMRLIEKYSHNYEES